MPAPNTQISADTERGLAFAIRRTIRVEVETVAAPVCAFAGWVDVTDSGYRSGLTW
jgi:hypothetical protein